MAGSAAAVVGAAATPCRPPQPRQGSHARCRRHCRLPPVRAGLLDLLRGSGTSDTSLPQDSHGEELRAWMQARGMPPQQLAAVAVPGAGRGLAAAQAISAGEPLLRLPPDLILTPDAAQRASVLRPLLEASPLPAWSVLALWLAEARAAGEGSEWWPYVRLLPDRTGCVLEWSEEEVGWLRGSQLHASALEIRRAADASWQEMQPLLADGEAQGLAPRGAFTREALQWAFAMLLSRLVRLPSLGGGGGGGEPSGTEALLPWADLLNHSPDCTAFLDWSPADGAVVLRADRRYRAGEQVHVSYGQKTGGELLLSYGFSPDPSANPHDGCSLRMELPAGGPAAEWKASAAARHGFAASQLFPLRMAAAPWELMHFAGLGAAAASSRAEVDELAARLFQRDDFLPDLQPAALEAVVQACQAAQQAYPSSFDDARAEADRLAAALGSGGQPSRREQVLRVLVYERQVLARTVFVLQQELKDLRRRALP